MRNWPWLILTPALIFVLIGVFAPRLMTHDPSAQDYNVILSPSSWANWLGTDYLGRDMFSRIIGGARTSLVAMVFVLLREALPNILIPYIVDFHPEVTRGGA